MNDNSLDNLKILIVDDIRSARKVLSALLKRVNIGKDIVLCETGEEALEKLTSEDFDLVLSDLNLNDIDGITLLEKMRAKPKHQNTPFIIITSDRDPVKPDKYILENVSGFLLKPFNSDELEQKIKSALNIF